MNSGYLAKTENGKVVGHMFETQDRQPASTCHGCMISYPSEKDPALPRSLLLDACREGEFLFMSDASDHPLHPQGNQEEVWTAWPANNWNMQIYAKKMAPNGPQNSHSSSRSPTTICFEFIGDSHINVSDLCLDVIMNFTRFVRLLNVRFVDIKTGLLSCLMIA